MISRKNLTLLATISLIIGLTLSSVIANQKVYLSPTKDNQQLTIKLNTKQVDANFSAHITIVLSFDNIWASPYLAKNLLLNLNTTVQQIYKNVTINYEIVSSNNRTDELGSIDHIIQNNNKTLCPGTQYLIFIGRQVTQNIDTNANLFAKWFNSTWNNQTTVKAVSFIDSFDNPSAISNALPANAHASVQYYNRTLAGIIAGVWSMFASNKSNQVGVILPWGPSYSCYNPYTVYGCNNFSDYYTGAYSGIFSGASYVDEKVKNNALYQISSNNIDFNSSLAISNPLNLTQNENNTLITANYNVATNFIQNGVDSIVGFGNTGEQGILQAISEHQGVSGILLDTHPYPNYNTGRIAYIYQNYTNAILKQINFWARYNTTKDFQQIYVPSPNSQDYILDNHVVMSPLFTNITQEILNGTLVFNALNQNNVQIVSGYDWLGIIGGLGLIVLVFRRKGNNT